MSNPNFMKFSDIRLYSGSEASIFSIHSFISKKVLPRNTVPTILPDYLLLYRHGRYISHTCDYETPMKKALLIRCGPKVSTLEKSKKLKYDATQRACILFP